MLQRKIRRMERARRKRQREWRNPAMTRAGVVYGVLVAVGTGVLFVFFLVWLLDGLGGI